MMHPHDPKAPAKETINCGSVSEPKPRGWKTTQPDHKPFTPDELARNPTLKAVAEGCAAGDPTLRELLARQGKVGAGGTAGSGRGATLENMSSAFEVAKAGGKHAGWLKQRLEDGPVQLRKGMRSIARQIAQHEAWIANPAAKVQDIDSRLPAYQVALVAGWRDDIARQQEQMDILRGVLKEKGHE